MIMRMDAGSVPVGYLVFESEKTTLGAMGDLAQNIIRPLVQKNVPGTVAISPFGPNMRSIIISVDPQKLLDYNLNPQQVNEALAKGNTIIPAGNIYVQRLDADGVQQRDDRRHPAAGGIPLKLGMNVYLRDIATIKDDTDITYGYALVNGKKAVYLPIIKKDTGSTLTVVADVRKSMQLFRDAVPPDVKVSFEFDESPTVLAAVESVASEGMIGAVLTGLMILLFLRDWRSVIVVVANIPLALLGSMFGLWITGNTINIMSLGGMALAIGILVDEATVTVENIHVQMESTEKVATAVLRGSLATAVPRLLALLCILSVFIPAFIMTDPLRSLFMPLTLAVGFAMISSYFLSSTFVPIMCVTLLQAHQEEGRRGRRVLRQDPRGLRQVDPPVRRPSGAGGHGLPGGLRGRHRRARPPDGDRVVPADRLRRVRPPVPPAARLELRADPRDGGEVLAGDRERGEGREHPDHHGVRRPGRPELRHRQHGAVHEGPGRRPAPRRVPRGHQDQAGRVPRADEEGPAREGDPLAGTSPGPGGPHRGRGEAAGEEGDLSASSPATS